jgi:aminoglycoside 6'-N-acetyltransferase
VIAEDAELSLRRMREDDLAAILAWRRQPHVRQFWDNDDDGGEIGDALIDEHYRPMLDHAHPTTAAIICVGGVGVGYLQFYRWASYADGATACGIPLDDHAFGLDVFVGDPAYTGRGVGARAVDLACRYLFETHGASRVALLTSKDNAGAQRAYERAGFVRVREALDTDTRGGVRIASWLMVRDRA